jgi:lactate dehydrogenase-like 2-hydroxyacid dehydrogenase
MLKRHHLLIANKFHEETIDRLDQQYQTHHLWKLTESRKKLLIESLEGQCRLVATASWNTDPFIYNLKSLKLIACFGVGIDGIDLITIRNRGVRVTNTPDVLTDAVADLAMGLLLSTSRNLVNADKFVRAGSWQKGAFPFGSGLAGKTLGIAGLGRIGLAIAQRAEAFKLKIEYHSRSKVNQPYGYHPSLEALATASDFFLCVLPGGDFTKNCIGKNIFKKIGPAGIFINIGRGSCVDEEALAQSLSNGDLGAAGLDVYSREPEVNPTLTTLSNVVLLPHIGSATIETREAMGQLVIDNLNAEICNKKLISEVKN